MTLNYKHPAVRISGLIVAGIVAVVLVWFLIGRLFPDNPKGPTENEITSDSLRLTKPAELALLDSIDARISRRGLISNQAESGARTSQDRAARNRRVADSLAIAQAWEGAYTERTVEAANLRTAVAQKDTVILALKADAFDLRTQLTIGKNRLAATERVNEGLIEDLAKARRCKIIGLINCPSRIQTVALTALAVVAVDRYQARQ